MDHDWNIHPGETLAETLMERNLSQAELSRRSGWTTKHINQVVKGRVAISVEFALMLEEELGIPARFWLNLQINYDLALYA